MNGAQLGAVGALAVLTAFAEVRAADEPFDFELLQHRARMLAARPYAAPPRALPDWLRRLDYDQCRDIRFDPLRAWWREEGLPFQLQFFHPGGLFSQAVQLQEVVAGRERPIGFSPRLFDYGRNRFSGRVPADLGFAGFRVHYALNRPEYLDELIVFLGASYFRALGAGQRYGLSARGLALNSGEPGGEEFPVFEAFWITRPAPGDRTLTLHALLNGPSVTGAYRFLVTPGPDTVVQVRAALYFRQHPRAPGLAPLTSMFAHGENTGWARDDYRPEVHDSDGLLLATGSGEWLWRPLTNPAQVRLSSFADLHPRGFGLLQRDRDFAHYDDLEAAYELRPSAWVEPVGDWGPGVVRLVELPTAGEANDNLVACWVPAQLPPLGEPLLLEYRLHWTRGEPGPSALGRVLSTRVAAVFGRPELRRFVLEFVSPYLHQAATGIGLAAVVDVGEGARLEAPPVLQKNPHTGAWRVVFEIRPEGRGRSVEMRCHLTKPGHVLTETWSYLWSP